MDESFESLSPAGRVNENLVAGVNLFTNAIGALDPASRIIFPDKADTAIQEAHAVNSDHFPYTLSPDFMVGATTKLF